MAREVDERKTRRALNRLKRAREAAEARGEEFSGWETEFVESVEARLKTYGSAFRDPEKGDLSEPLSGRQRQKMREIDKKARGRIGEKKDDAEQAKPRKTLQQRKPMKRGSGFRTKAAGARKGAAPRVRDIADELSGDDAPEAGAARPAGPPRLRVIDGGAED